MWFEKPPTKPDWTRARAHLSRVDPVMKRLIRRVGACTLAPKPPRDYFVTLCKSIYTQQISTKIATILYGRFSEQFPRRTPTPPRVVEFLTNGDADLIKRCGLSRQKREYILDLARHFADNQIPTRRLARMGDEEVIESLVRVKGVGRWTAEMFLIFVLNRSDVWPADDLGLQESYKRFFNLTKRPTRKELDTLGARFRPHRTVATWYLWRALSLPSPSARARTRREDATARKNATVQHHRLNKPRSVPRKPSSR